MRACLCVSFASFPFSAHIAKAPAADADYCAAVKSYASLGIWLIRTEEELERSTGEFGADVIETDGTLKPRQSAARPV